MEERVGCSDAVELQTRNQNDQETWRQHWQERRNLPGGGPPWREARQLRRCSRQQDAPADNHTWLDLEAREAHARQQALSARDARDDDRRAHHPPNTYALGTLRTVFTLTRKS